MPKLKHCIKNEYNFTTYSQTCQIYTKKLIKIGQVVSEEFGYNHCDMRILYIYRFSELLLCMVNNELSNTHL